MADLDLNLVHGRYFNVRIGEITLDVEPCKLKTIRKFTALANNVGDEDLVEIAVLLLNKNKTKYVVTPEIVEELDIDQINYLLLGYFSWIGKEKANNPN